MIPGLRGSLLSEDALEHVVPDALRGRLGEAERAKARRRLRAWHTSLRRVLGPASASRTIFDRLAVPLFSHLGYRACCDSTVPVASSEQSPARILRALLECQGRVAAALIVTGWEQDAATAWRDSVRQGIARGVRWCFCLTGPSLRITDSRRTYSRRYVEFDLETAIDDEHTFSILWGLLRSSAMIGTSTNPTPLLDLAVDISEKHRASVRTSLRTGVEDALRQLNVAFQNAMRGRGRSRSTGHSSPSTLNEALIVIYRVLFLLFAEARGLVPGWHPVYRDGYTIESLRDPVERLPRPRGLWETIQSIARLAHRGCRIGELQVTPFNGRLFSPTESPLADSLSLDDSAVRHALLALTTRCTNHGRQRIAYSDLGVEQLGGVYESVLDLEPSADRFVRTERRKTTGSFYTPRSLTEYLVRRTLAPLVSGKTSEEILSLRILDPAMGSGAFLVAACRYLASAYEAALVRDNVCGPEDIDERERADFRRAIAQRCLYGVDINPMAVQLGRLSLWLTTLAAERPLTFLDHRLRTGNSLVGASLMDLARQPARGKRGSSAHTSRLPLFEDDERDRQLRRIIAVRDAIAAEPGHTLAQVRAKEHALARLGDENPALARWREACDVWCSTWFVTESGRHRPPVSALIDTVLERPSLPEHVVRPFVDRARATAARERFFHWTLEFPEVFSEDEGGFDAVLGNPPWEMLRGDTGDAAGRQAARQAACALTDFARGSGVYSLQGRGHANLYQLFLERMLGLLRPGGRLGVVLPAGLATDHGAGALRRTLLRRTTIDTLIAIENKDGIFPIHRALKFLLITSSNSGETKALPCRFGVRRLECLDQLPDMGPQRDAVIVPRALLERMSGEELAILDVRSQEEVALVSQIAFSIPALASDEGWGVTFGRELNASDDRRHFHPASSSDTGLPVIEGKQIGPFVADVDRPAFRIRRDAAARLLDPDRTFLRPRLAYRDVAAATNRLTLIAAIVPPLTVTTHTLFCLRTDLDEECRFFLCAMFNSFVANYLVRLRVGTHVTIGIIGHLPMPRPVSGSTALREIAGLSRALTASPTDAVAHARVQALAARLYGLNRAQFAHVLSTFPLVPQSERTAAMHAFCDIVD
jgi:N-6 DNA Methylase/Eco57I restriction-modification methylase